MYERISSLLCTVTMSEERLSKTRPERISFQQSPTWISAAQSHSTGLIS